MIYSLLIDEYPSVRVEDGDLRFTTRSEARRYYDALLDAPLDADASADMDAQLRASWGRTPDAIAESERVDRELGLTA